MMRPIELILSRLEGVRQVAPNKWIARSPTRRDRTPSLSIRELDDGRVLVHDFGGASVDEILSAIGLSVIDLIPEHLRHKNANALPVEERRRWAAEQVIAGIGHHVVLVAILAAQVREGLTPSDDDMAALLEADKAINEALRVAGLPRPTLRRAAA